MNFLQSKKCFNPHHRWHNTGLFATEWCEWKFIPSHGPHFGGLWEAAVKSLKYLLRRTLGSQVATYEELCTLLAEIEACLNSRPLCALSDDPFNPTYFSPGHFLIGEPLNLLPVADFTNVKCNRFSRWQTQQNICNSSGNVVYPTTSRVCNSVNASRGHHLTYNQLISSWWGRTTRHLFTGRKL